MSATDTIIAEALTARRIKLTPVSEIDAEPVEWLWEGRFPLAHLSLAAGKPDLGKSQFAVWLAAQVSRGRLPGDMHGKPRGVIYYATEDSFKMTIRPRLEAADADLGKVYRLDPVEYEGSGYSLSLVDDLDDLAELVEENEIGLVVFDPLVSVATGTDWNKAADVRAQLSPLTSMLEARRCSAVGLVHFRKAFGSDVLGQIAGSGAWGQVVRAAVAFARDPDSEDQKRVVMSQAKNNLGRSDLPSLTFTFEPVAVPTKSGKDANVSRIVWGEESAWTVEEIITGKNTDNAKNATDLAQEWLATCLAHGVPMPVGEVKKSADAAGHAWRTVQRAAKLLPITQNKRASTWQMRLGAGASGVCGAEEIPASSSAPSAPHTPNNSLQGLAQLPVELATSPTSPTSPGRRVVRRRSQ